MNDSWSWAKGSCCYEKLKALNGRNDFGLWAEDSRLYDQLKVVDEMNDSRCEHGALDVMKT